MKEKVQIQFTIELDQQEWLARMAQEYNLDDVSKALRVLLDYAMEDGDQDEIFAPQHARCRRC